MKTKTIFKRSTLLITAIVVSALLVIAAVAVIATGVESDAALGAKYGGVRVSTGGTMDIQFLYTDLGSATHVVTEVNNTNSGQLEVSEIPVSSLKTVTAGDESYRVVTVSLPAARITDTVTVYPKNGDTIGTKRTTSIPEYAHAVLADEDYASYHNVIEAMLNYGAMAQEYFGVATDNLANEGLYTHGNPAYANYNLGLTYTPNCNCDSCMKKETVVFAHGAYEAVLNSSTALRFYFTYSGENAANLSATVSRAGTSSGAALENQPIEIKTDSNGNTYAEIRDISAKLYATQYRVTFTDGTNSMTYSGSVMSYVTSLLSNVNSTYTQRNAATALYRYYVWTANVAPAQDTCAHSHTHYVSKDASTDVAVCSDCGLTIENATIPAGLNGYLDASYLASIPQGGQYNFDSFFNPVGSDSDSPYVRMQGMNTSPAQVIWTRLGGNIQGPYPNAQINPLIVDSSSKYMVFKVRTNTDISNFELTIGTVVGDVTYSNKDAQKTAAISVPDSQMTADKWTTFVIDFDRLMTDVMQDDNGVYQISYLQFTFYTSGGVTITADEHYDFSYIAFCENWSDITKLVENDDVDLRRIVASDNSVAVDAATGYCANDDDTFFFESSKAVQGGTQYSYCCAYCDKLFYERFVDANVNKFISANDLLGIKDYTNANGLISEELLFEKYTVTGADGTASERYRPFIRYTQGTGGNHLNLWSVPTHGGGGQATPIGATTGRYLVFKYRTTGEINPNFHIGTGSTTTQVIGAMQTGGEWRTAVLDLAAFSSYECNAPEGTAVKIRVDGGFSEGTLDIADLAIVDNVAEAAMVISDDTYKFYPNFPAASTTYYERYTSTHLCTGAHNYVDTTVDNVCYFGCSKCVLNLGSKNLTGAENIFVSAVDVYHAANSTNAVGSPEFMLEENGETFVRFDGEKYHASASEAYHQINLFNNSAGDISTGEYLVIRYRLGDNGLKQNIIRFFAGTKNNGATNGNEMFDLRIQEDNQWHTVVVNMTTILASKNNEEYKAADDGNYYTKFIAMRPFTDLKQQDAETGAWSSKANADDYMDIAYLAMFDSLDEVNAFIGEGDYDYHRSYAKVSKLNANGKCTEHIFETENVTQNESNTVYSYTCELCEETFSRTVPNTVNLYYSPLSTSNKKNDYNWYLGTQAGEILMADESGTPFVRYHGRGGASQFIYNRWTASGEWSESHQLNVGDAKFYVVKMRVSDDLNRISSIPLDLGSGIYDLPNKTNISAKQASISLPVSKLRASDWITFVVPIEHVLPNAWVAESDGTFYNSFQQYTFYGEIDSTVVVDIAFTAFVSDYAEAMSIAENSTVELITTHNGAYVPLTPDADPCEAGHSIKEFTYSEYRAYRCTMCGEEISRKTISSDIEFLSPVYLSTQKISSGIINQGFKVDDDGTGYIRIKNEGTVDATNFPNGTWTELYPIGQNTGKVFIPNDSKYLVVKVRLNGDYSNHATHNGSNRIWVKIGHNNGGDESNPVVVKPKTFNFGTDKMVNGKWTVFVIDMTSLETLDYKLNSSGTYPVLTEMHLHSSLAVGETIDWAYVAACKDWAEIDELVDENTVEYWLGAKSTATYSTKSGQCVTHTYVESREGDTWSYKCSVCGEGVTKTVPESAAFISAVTLSNRKVSGNVVKEGLLFDDEIPYTGFTNQSSVAGNFAGTWGEIYPVGEGQGVELAMNGSKYLVIKLKMTGSYASHTAGYWALRLRVGHNSGGENFNTVVSKKTISLSPDKFNANEWKVVVVDLSTITSLDYKLNPSTGKYPNITEMNINSSLKVGESLDVAYIAGCEDWSMIQALVDESTVLLVDGEGTRYVNKDGTAIAAE